MLFTPTEKELKCFLQNPDLSHFDLMTQWNQPENTNKAVPYSTEYTRRRENLNVQGGPVFRSN